MSPNTRFPNTSKKLRKLLKAAEKESRTGQVWIKLPGGRIIRYRSAVAVFVDTEGDIIIQAREIPQLDPS